MSSRSVRARLTALVAVVAAVLGVLGATVGVGAVEHDLVANAVDEAGDEQLGLVEELLAVAGGFEDPFAFDPDLQFSDDFLPEWEVEALVVLLDDLDLDGGLDELRDALGHEAGEPVEVLTYFGEVVRYDPGGGVAEWPLDIDDAVGPIVPQAAIEELFFLKEDLRLDEVFAFAVEDGGEGSEDDLEFSVVERAGVEFLIFADVGDVRASVDRIRALWWMVVPLLALGAGMLAWFLTGRALRPVHAITSRVGEISGGNLHERVPEPATGDEIADLAATMNAMLDRLEVDDARLRRFVSDASHELRSPVAVLRSEAEVAARVPQQVSVEDLAAGVLGETERLQRIVEDLLVLARGEERRSGVPVEVDVDDVVLAEAVRRRRLPVDTREVSAGRVLGTVEAVQRIVSHLLDNAARHGSGHVAVGLRAEEGAVTLWVDDDGPGIAPDDRQRVFERFTRLDAARTRDRGGAGLGLAVVAETMHAMGGSAAVAEAPGGGARLVLRWPMAPG